jgi:histidine phosphotransfer protein HptB
MDFKAMAQSMGLEEDEFIEVLALFVEVSESDLLNMATGLKNEDAKSVSNSAHSIKGAALNLGLTGIANIAQSVEMKAREDNLQGVSEATHVIREKLDEIQSVSREP